METIGLGFCFEDLPVGRTFKTIGRTVTDADITNFVNATGMVEVLFTNLHFLQHESDIKGRVAPGALVYASTAPPDPMHAIGVIVAAAPDGQPGGIALLSATALASTDRFIVERLEGPSPARFAPA